MLKLFFKVRSQRTRISYFRDEVFQTAVNKKIAILHFINEYFGYYVEELGKNWDM